MAATREWVTAPTANGGEYVVDSLQAAEGAPFPLHVGRLAHALIAEYLTVAERNGTEPWGDLTVLARILAADPLQHDRRRGELLLRSYARCYLETFRLPKPWRLDAVERRRPDGRIDLLFRNPVTGEVLADELKAGCGRPGLLSLDELEQVARYLRQLYQEFGEKSLGVRFIRLGPPAHAYVFRSIADLADPLAHVHFGAR